MAKSKKALDILDFTQKISWQHEEHVKSKRKRKGKIARNKTERKSAQIRRGANMNPLGK